MRKMALSLCAIIFMVLWTVDLASSHQHFSPAYESHDHHHCSHHKHNGDAEVSEPKLPEELAEEEDLKLYEFGSHHHHDHQHDHHHDHHHLAKSDLSGLELWVNALGCSFLVSMASLVCLIILPLIFIQGKPSRTVVDSLALFGAGAMLGDAFLHQLPHAFGGEHSHSHDHDVDSHEHSHSGGHGHSLKDLSVGISVLAGIVLFLLVEKIVRYVEDNSRGANTWSHSHHHHHSKKSGSLDGLENCKDNDQSQSDNGDKVSSEKSTDKKELQKVIEESSDGNKTDQSKSLRKRKKNKGSADVDSDEAVVDGASKSTASLEKELFHPPSNLVFGYLNLFSDGVHNFTDGMALGSAFLLYGSVGGWSRTLFLLAHELPQEVGDFGILVRSGFSVPKALFFNFLSALVALAGTALALIWGQDPGQSSLIEGFTAGGFIYIAVAGVLAEMNNSGNSSSIKTAIGHLISLTLGMVVALCISLVE